MTTAIETAKKPVEKKSAGRAEAQTQSSSSRQFGDLVIAFTTNYSLRWNDSGSGADRDVSFWHPVVPEGFHALGSIAVSNHDNPGGKFASMMVKAAPGKESALLHPTDYTMVWADWGTGSDMDGSCWRPVPPPGYVALGDVVVSGYNKPSLPDVVCVSRDLVFPGKIAQNSTWDDGGSGGEIDFSCWQVEASSAYLDTPDGIFAANTFLGQGGYSRPESSPVNWNLRLPLPSFEGQDAPKPDLINRERPQAHTNPVVDRVVTVPFTAILDRDRTLAEQVAEPFYEVRRLVDYTLVLFLNNTGNTEQEASTEISTGVTTEQSETYSKTYGISVTTEFGVKGGGFSAKASVTLSYELGYSKTETVSQFRSQTDQVSLRCPPKHAAAAWVESHAIRVVRGDGTPTGPDISLNPSDTSYLFADFPKGDPNDQESQGAMIRRHQTRVR